MSRCIKTLYAACLTPLQDVVYGLLNIKAMQLVGGGAQNFQQWFDFLGLIKDKQPTRIGAPYQMDFPGEHALPPGMSAMKESIPTCWDPAFKCSCGDCPDAPQCIPVSFLCLLLLTVSPILLAVGPILLAVGPVLLAASPILTAPMPLNVFL